MSWFRDKVADFLLVKVKSVSPVKKSVWIYSFYPVLYKNNIRLIILTFDWLK